MRLTVDRPAIAEDRADSRADIIDEKKTQSEFFEKESQTVHNDVREGIREPEYNRCIELKRTVGLASLGLTTNQVWYDDPRGLTFLLARYKFVAKILSGSRSAGEVGGGDGFGTRIVLKEIADVTVYDFDPQLVEDIREREDKRWQLKAEVHDIV